MGIVNVTPDSFSDGGETASVSDAVERALKMIAEGASIVDIGGESSRPGADSVSLAEELERVIPVVRALRGQTSALLSIDTCKAAVARRALAEGADIINDISAGSFDEDMIPLVAESGAGYVIMHMQGTPSDMQNDPQYDDVVREVFDFLSERLQRCVSAGIAGQSLIVDPGIGFGKTTENNLQLIRGFSEFVGMGAVAMIGASRKSFIAGTLRQSSDVNQRLGGSLAAAMLAVERGAQIVRVHDVPETVQALKVMTAVSQVDFSRAD